MTPRSDVKETAVAGIGSWLKRLIQPFFFFKAVKGPQICCCHPTVRKDGRGT